MNLTSHDDGDVIDAIARGMTLDDPSGALRVRVLENLPSRRTPWNLRLGFPIGTAAAAALAWMLIGPSGPASVSTSVSTSRSAAVSTSMAPNGPAVVTSQRLTGADAPPTQTVRRARPNATMSAEDLAWHARAVAPLPAFAPIEFPAIQPTALSIAPISVDPIVTDPIPPKAPDAPPGGRQYGRQ